MGSSRSNLRHLNGALANLVGSSGKGMCFFRSAALVLDVPGSELAIGVLAGATAEELAANPDASTTPFIHAWVERGDTVVSPTQIEREGRLMPWPKQFYYETNGITEVRTVSRPALLKLSGEIGLSAHLRLNRPLKQAVSLAFLLLDQTGLAYAVAEDGGIRSSGIWQALVLPLGVVET